MTTQGVFVDRIRFFILYCFYRSQVVRIKKVFAKPTYLGLLMLALFGVVMSIFLGLLAGAGVVKMAVQLWRHWQYPPPDVTLFISPAFEWQLLFLAAVVLLFLAALVVRWWARLNYYFW